MQNLRKRGMNVSTICPICEIEEDREHVIYKFRWTEAVWFNISGLGASQHSRQSIEEWIQDRRNKLCTVSTTREARWCLCMITYWHIWKSRCIAAFEAKMPNPTTIVDDIKRAFKEYMGALKVRAKTSGLRVTQGWNGSSREVIKVNCNASCCRQTKMVEFVWLWGTRKAR